MLENSQEVITAWKIKYNDEVLKHKISRLDYDDLAQEHEALKTETKKATDENLATIAAQEKELAVLRSYRTDAKVEKCSMSKVVSKAVNIAFATKLAEMEKLKREFEAERATLQPSNEDKNVLISDLRQGMAFMEETPSKASLNQKEPAK